MATRLFSCILLSGLREVSSSQNTTDGKHERLLHELVSSLFAVDHSMPPSTPWLPEVLCHAGMSPETSTNATMFRTATEGCQDDSTSEPNCPLTTSIGWLKQRCWLTSELDSDGQHVVTEPLASDLQNIRSAFSSERLRAHAANAKAHFQNNAPFPNIVIDDFLPWDLYRKMEEEIPMLPVAVAAKYCAVDWLHCESNHIWQWLKWTFPVHEMQVLKSMESHLGPATRLVVDVLRSTSFLDFLEQMTGISNLMPDPLLWGGGIHQIAAGGYLAVHQDFDMHPVYSGLKRRVNLFLYANPWQGENYGGDLELWEVQRNGEDVIPIRCRKKIAVNANRGVIFDMSHSSYHGHPWPLLTPSNVTRRSLAFYYYTIDTAGKTGDGSTPVVLLHCKSRDDPQCYGDTEVIK